MLRNGLPGQEGAGLFKIANLPESELAEQDLQLIKRAEAAARKVLDSGSRVDLKKQSPELNAILS